MVGVEPGPARLNLGVVGVRCDGIGHIGERRRKRREANGIDRRLPYE